MAEEQALQGELRAVARRLGDHDGPARAPSGGGDARPDARSRAASVDSKNDIVRQLFHLSPRVRIISDYSCAVERKVLFHGRMFVTDSCVCFYSNLFGFEKKIILPYRKLVRITKEKTALVIPNAIALTTERKEYVFRSFWGRYRDECYDLIRQAHRKYVGLPAGADDLGDAPALVVPSVPSSAPRLSEGGDAPEEENDSGLGAPTPAEDPAALLEALTDGSPLKNHCLSTTLPLSMQGFFETFVADSAPCSMVRFHRLCRGDRDVLMDEWSEEDPQFGMSRNINFVAPVDAPIGPKQTRAHKLQRYRFYGDAGLVLESSTRMQDIPYGDYFSVEERVVVRPGAGNSCRMTWAFEVRFTKSTMLRSTIESGTNASIEKGANSWVEMATQFLAGELPPEGEAAAAAVAAAVDEEEEAPPPRMVWVMMELGRSLARLLWLGHLIQGLSQLLLPLLVAYLFLWGAPSLSLSGSSSSSGGGGGGGGCGSSSSSSQVPGSDVSQQLADLTAAVEAQAQALWALEERLEACSLTPLTPLTPQS